MVEVKRVYPCKASGVARCIYCGRGLHPGQLFVILERPREDGQFQWVYAHIECDARKRLTC